MAVAPARCCWEEREESLLSFAVCSHLFVCFVMPNLEAQFVSIKSNKLLRVVAMFAVEQPALQPPLHCCNLGEISIGPGPGPGPGPIYYQRALFRKVLIKKLGFFSAF